MKPTNPRKGKYLRFLWLTGAESESIKESLKNLDKYGQNIIDIFEEVNSRGDFIWIKKK